MTKDKKPTTFDFLNQIFYKTKKHPYDKKIVNSYLISLWLSHDKSLINIVNNINSYQFLFSDEILYKYYFDRVPKGKRFIRWTKKEPVDKKMKKKIDAIVEEHGVSKSEAKSILKHLEYIGEI